MEAVAEQEDTRFRSGLSHDEYLKSVGRLQAFETALTLIDTLDQQQRERDEHRTTARIDVDASRIQSTWGTPYWNR